MKILIDGQTLSTPERDRGIGAVFLRLSEQLIANDLSKEWFLSVRDAAALNHLPESMRERVIPLYVGESLREGNYDAQTKEYSGALQEVVRTHHIDAYWNPNPFMMNVVLPTELQGIPIFATVYDLIPWVLRESFLDTWPPHLQAEYSRRLMLLPHWADRLCFISEHSKHDYARFDPLVEAKAVVVPLGIDHARYQPPMAVELEPANPYVLMVGGFDPRKNMDRALEAFAALVQEHAQEYAQLRFYVVCGCDPQARARYESMASRLGIRDRLQLTGFVDESSLIDLYRRATVFFFPSLYEGFGLPVLEAMACGVPVVTTRISSIPEIAGETSYYCSDTDKKDMTRALHQAIRERSTNSERRREAISRASSFSWADAAARYCQLMTHAILAQRIPAEVTGVMRIAHVSPWPPQRTGIADYSLHLVSHLKERAEVTLYLEDDQPTPDHSLGLQVEKLSNLPAAFHDYDAVIYHLGNNRLFHKQIYQIAWENPGIVVLHEYNLHPFLTHSYWGTDQEHLYADALEEGYGRAGSAYYDSLKKSGGEPDVMGFPMSHAILQRSKAAIVHSRWVREQCSAVNQVFIVPHGIPAVRHSNDVACRTLRAQLGVDSRAFVVGTFGFITRFKRVLQALEAVRLLRDKGFPIQFLIGGDAGDFKSVLKGKIKELGLEEYVIFTGYLSDEEFVTCLQMVDVVLNLRFPSLGESSGSLAKAFGSGKACIVSDHHQFAELPNSVCWKAGVDEWEVKELAAYIAELLRNPQVRSQLGRNAAFYSQHYASYNLAADLYLDIAHRTAVRKRCFQAA